MNLKTKRMILASSLCCSFLIAHAQKTLTGTVTDANGEPMIGVSLQVDGTNIGGVTDLDGKFSITNIPEKGTLKVSYVGYNDQRIQLTGKPVINIVMQESQNSLDELVVVGYGVIKKSDLTGSVGSVHSGDITEKGSTSLAGSLQGSVAGVNITQSSSRAGDSFTMQIRGKSSLQGGQPLYVVDGIVCDNIDFLNPMDIEKVDILKDASSTAIYGSRATNGVLMITTKKGAAMGSETKATISYDGYYGFKSTANMPDFMSGRDWMKWRVMRYYTSKLNAATGETAWTLTDANYKLAWCNYSPRWQDNFKNNTFTDWPELVTRNGTEQNHFVNITGSSKNLNYRVALGYQNEKGVFYDDYERWNMKASLDHQINKHWRTGASINLATSSKSSGSYNAIVNGFRMSPQMDAFYWDGEKAGQPITQPGKDTAIYPNGGGPTSTLNPIVDRENSKDRTRSYDALGNIYLQYSPIEELIFKTTLSPMYNKKHRGQSYGALSQARFNKTNEAIKANDEIFSYTWDTQANFIKRWGDHSLNALALFSAYQQRTEGDGIDVTDMPFDVDWYNIGSASTVENKSSYYEKITMLSWVLRANYDYLGRYYLTVSSRWDGSSKFQKDNRWGMFPSAAFAWRISEEPWMKNTHKWLSNLKLRLSYGVTGNNGMVGPYQTQLLANQKYYYNFGNTIANGYGYELANTDLTWEKTNEFDVGLDFGFLNSRINGSVDFYSRTSKDLLMEMETPLEMGSATGAIWGNVGKVRNTGVEVQLNTVNVKNKDWMWTTNFTFAHNHNEILELNGGKQDLTGNGWFIGQPIDVVYGYVPNGICTAEMAKAYAADASKKTKFYEGEYMVKDMNNDGVIDPTDRRVQGHNDPTWTGSLNSELKWKYIDFSFNIYTSQGSRVYSPFMAEFTDYSQRGMQRLKMDFYTPAGVQLLGDDGELYTTTEAHYGNYPFPTNGGNNKGAGQFWVSGKTGTQYFVNNSFTKIKNITLGFTFPKQWISPIGLSYLRFYVNVVNPFVITGYKGFDPEWAGSAINDGTGGPASRSFQIGLNVKF